MEENGNKGTVLILTIKFQNGFMFSRSITTTEKIVFFPRQNIHLSFACPNLLYQAVMFKT